MVKTVAKLTWDARAAPVHLLARLYLIVRSDFEQWQLTKPFPAQPRHSQRVDNPFLNTLAQDHLPATELLIKGICRDGEVFRPSDWAERLCGAVVVFLPGATSLFDVQSSARPYHGYTTYVRPAIINGIYYVIVDSRLRHLEPRAWDYVTSFAHDNDLVMFDATELLPRESLPEMSLAAA